MLGTVGTINKQIGNGVARARDASGIEIEVPEAARGEPLGPESDLYGVGVLLGWGLHGALPEPGVSLPVGSDPLSPLYADLTDPLRTRRPSDAGAVRGELLRLAALPS